MLCFEQTKDRDTAHAVSPRLIQQTVAASRSEKAAQNRATVTEIDFRLVKDTQQSPKISKT